MKLVIEVEYDESTWPEDPEEGAQLELALQDAIYTHLWYRNDVEVLGEVELRHDAGESHYIHEEEL